VDVLTGDGVLRVFEVQIEGDQRTVAAAVIKSIRATLGLRTGELLERIQALERRLDILLEAQFPTSHRNK
jgi:predicted nuclease of restriction endonuclease-like RecB superfamily